MAVAEMSLRDRVRKLELILAKSKRGSAAVPDDWLDFGPPLDMSDDDPRMKTYRLLESMYRATIGKEPTTEVNRVRLPDDLAEDAKPKRPRARLTFADLASIESEARSKGGEGGKSSSPSIAAPGVDRAATFTPMVKPEPVIIPVVDFKAATFTPMIRPEPEDDQSGMVGFAPSPFG